jgi:hypothetical protein
MRHELFLEWIEHPFVGLLLAFGVALLLAARTTLALLRPRAVAAAWAKLSHVLGICLLCLFVADAIGQIDQRVQPERAFVFRAATVGAVTAASLAFWKSAVRSNDGATASAGPPVGPMRGVLFLWLGAAAWFGGRFYTAAFPAMAVVDDSQVKGGLSESKEFVGWTDRGREIRLFNLVGEPERSDTKSAGSQNSIDDYPEMAILRQSRSVRSNCHGWVFCDGRFILPGDDIDHILEDNAYCSVEQPRGGDLILYRDANGQAMHSGVVRGILDDGTVMVESKWGVDRLYLHTAVDQPYSQLFTYYRSPRHGHRLTITKALPDDLRLSPGDKRALHSMLHVAGNDRKSVPAQGPKASVASARGQ